MTHTLTQPRLFPFEELPLSPIIEAAIARLSRANKEDRGAVYTKTEVVDFIFNLLSFEGSFWRLGKTLLEPSFGGGDFLLPAARTIFTDYQKTETDKDSFSKLCHCVRAYELHCDTFETTRSELTTLAQKHGFSRDQAATIAGAWLHQGDFLLSPISATFDIVVGNPPYIRQESIPDVLLNEYRQRFRTIYDRADIYVPFIERSLSLLKNKGRLGFICSDRWMKNRYGAPLRRFITTNFHVCYVVDMVEANAFHSDVTAYPAVIVIDREESKPTRLAKCESVTPSNLEYIACQLRENVSSECQLRQESDEPWLLDAGPETRIVRRIEKTFPTLEEAGCKIGIGVATGADKVYIGNFAELDVEDSRKLPLAMTKDIESGKVIWRGKGVINPFEDNGKLVDLALYPRLAAYFSEHEETIKSRNIAKKSSENWYRTIDKITPSLTSVPKLLVPDIKGRAHFVYDKGELYPHHNLYFITSENWDLRALHAILMAGAATFFVSAYSTKMRGDFLRFQAQNLRRIRVPHWGDVSAEERKALIASSESLDFRPIRPVVLRLYGITDNEATSITF